MRRPQTSFQQLPGNPVPKASPLSLRGNNVSRLEGFSDAVFGFALTILVVSLDAPRTFTELQTTVRGAIPFALCFAFLMLVWYKHYRFFRDYGLEDNTTIVLNAVLLFTVMFYVYPLRLLFHLWVAFATTDENGVSRMIGSWGETAQVFALFGVGFAAVMSIFGFLYAHALTKRNELALSSAEVITARVTMIMSFVYAGVGAISALVALPQSSRNALIAVWMYLLILPLVFLLKPYLRRRLLKQ